MMNRSPAQQDNSLMRRFLGELTRYIKMYLVIKPLQFVFPSKPYEQRMARLRSLPENTVGRDLAQLLDSQRLRLIPGFEKHDLNHLILGYNMTPEDELCMQAYLIGNGHWQPQCFLFLSSAILLPGLWPELWAHFNLGRGCEYLSPLSLDDCLYQETETVRQKYTALRVPQSARRWSPVSGMN